jgi:uncharacterized protein YrrD
MSSIRTFLSTAASTIGPDAKNARINRTAQPSAISIASVKEEHIVISQLDQVLFESFGKDSPVIPAGVLKPSVLSQVEKRLSTVPDIYFVAGVAITAVILTSGLFALKNNNKAQQQVFMRLRVGAQAITVLAMMASLGVQERQKALGLYRR